MSRAQRLYVEGIAPWTIAYFVAPPAVLLLWGALTGGWWGWTIALLSGLWLALFVVIGLLGVRAGRNPANAPGSSSLPAPADPAESKHVHAALMTIKTGRVDPAQIAEVRQALSIARPYGGDDLAGVSLDIELTLDEGGFTEPDVQRTNDLTNMLVCSCRPAFVPQTVGEVITALEGWWLADGSTRHKAHVITSQPGHVILEFATWHDDGHYYTGRVDVSIPLELASVVMDPA